MKKTPNLFVRNLETGKIMPEVNPRSVWVTEGQGVATRKYDGTCCLIKNGVLFKRREIKKGKTPPANFTVADFDSATGKTVGWIPVNHDDKGDQWHCEAWQYSRGLEDGTYELIGPKIQGNPECRAYGHALVAHNTAQQFPDAPRDYDGLKEWLAPMDMEGLVFHHPDGRMVKIRKSDFGLSRV